MKKISNLTDEELDFFIQQNTVLGTLLQDYVKSVLCDVASFPRQNWFKKIKFVLKIYVFSFDRFAVAPAVYEIVEIIPTVTDIIKVKVVTIDVTLKTSLNMKKTSRSEERCSCNKLLGCAPTWDNFSDQV